MALAVDSVNINRRAGPASLAPVEQLTLQERVYRELKTALMAGRFAPGQTLTIKSLADAFGTSPMPVRESVRRLSAECALEVMPNRSVRLPLVSRGRFEELWHVRALVEGEAAGLAARYRSDAALADIEALNRQLSASMAVRDSDAMVRDNQAFHFAVYRASGNATLLPIIESLWLQSGPALAAAYAHDSPMTDSLRHSTAVHHADIVAAIGRGDAVAARAALRADIRSAGATFRDCYSFAPETGE